MTTKEAMQTSQKLERFVQNIFPGLPFHLDCLAGDASFRSYYRLSVADKTFVLMSAGQDKDSCAAFSALARAFRAADLMAPQILEYDEVEGYMLLSDLGDEIYLRHLSDKRADDLYQRAFDALFRLQTCTQIPHYSLPIYDRELYLREMNLFREWYLTQHLGFSLSRMENELLDYMFDLLIVEASGQPQVCVHRDFHSRNLMVLEPKNVGLLDFQDAVLGPLTYDLVSLLRDCYISWPEDRVRAWVKSFFEQKNALSPVMISDWEQFYRWFEWMGLQRHLKCMGIFARLHIRDKKPQYLDDIPRIVQYVDRVTRAYPEFKELSVFLAKRKILA